MRLLSLSFILMFACSSDPSDVGKMGNVVGGSCTTSGGASGTCAENSMCVVDVDFPGGSCVKSCVAQADCPDGSACIQENGGICVLSCDTVSDCRSDYHCVAKSTVNPAGSAKVCILQ